MFRFDHITNEILRREGGFVDHAADRGGPTKYGITQQTLSEHRGRPATRADVEQLSEAEAREIYEQRYIVGPGFADLGSPCLIGLIVDCGVNHGVNRAARWLQLAVGVADDGVIGPKTMAAVAAADPARLYRHVLAARTRFFGSIITRDPKLKQAREAGLNLQAEFASGWLNRVAEFIIEGP